MSDKLKEQYQQEFSKITPSPEFLQRLTETLEQEQASSMRKSISFKKMLPIAASLVLLIGAGSIYLNHSGKSQPHSGTAKTFDSPEMNFHQAEVSGMKEFDIQADAGSYAETLCSRLDSDELDYIKMNDTNNFTNTEASDFKEAEKIAKMLSDAELTDSCPDGEKMYYMLVFKDGSVEKIVVTDEKYIEISGKNICFKIN